jgi:pantothenate kinase
MPDPAISHPFASRSTELAEQILEILRQRPGVYLVGIAGVPGSGKTTLCRELAARRPEALIVSMDGYHLPRCELDAEGMRRRGALFTFDGSAFQRDLTLLRQTREGWFPTFDHAEKDPRPNAVHITPDVPLVIVEGVYVLMESWQSEQLFDLRIFLDIDLDEAVERLAIRHVQTGLANTLGEGRDRANFNDRVNSQVILADGCRERADLVLKTGIANYDHLKARGDGRLQARIEELAERNTEDGLTESEKAEYAGYVKANNLIAILQAKARNRLPEH